MNAQEYLLQADKELSAGQLLLFLIVLFIFLRWLNDER
jgi:hypothetical protein